MIPYIHSIVFDEIQKLIVYAEGEQNEVLPFEHHFDRLTNYEFIKEGINLLNILLQEPLNQIAPTMRKWFK
jgi:hypothetical protein